MSLYHWKASKELKTLCNETWQILWAVVRAHYLCPVFTNQHMKQKDAGSTLTQTHQRKTLLFQGSCRNYNNNCIVRIQVVWIRVAESTLTTLPMTFWVPYTPSVGGTRFWILFSAMGQLSPKNCDQLHCKITISLRL